MIEDTQQADDRNKSALFLTYQFTPGGNQYRSVKFAKYLPEFGWQLTVLTPHRQNKANSQVESNGCTAFRNVDVVRTGVYDPRNRIWDALSRLPAAWRYASVLKANLRYPDHRRHWYRDALPVARRLLRENAYDVIYSTSPPVTAHWIALRLKREFSIPWIADFRDPWKGSIPFVFETRERLWRWRRSLDQSLERQVYSNADVIVANTPSQRARIVQDFSVAPDKVITIPNGYDEEDFANLREEPSGNSFRITYCGSVYAHYSPQRMVDAIGNFMQGNKDANVKLTFAGSSCTWAEKNIQDPEIKPRLELLGQIPHAEVPRLLKSSHLLIQVLPPGTGFCVPSKLYEYMRSGTPIVAIGDRPSEMDRLLKETRRGVLFEHDNLDGVVQHIRELYEAWQRSEFPCRPKSNDLLLNYDRRNLAQKLAMTFEHASVKT